MFFALKLKEMMFNWMFNSKYFVAIYSNCTNAIYW